ncbi:MAG: hypothetical protein ABEH43_05530, partial [Flavobacteriales bacterium]
MVVLLTFGRFGMDTLLLRYTSRYYLNGAFGKLKDLYFKVVCISLTIALSLSLLLFLVADSIANTFRGGIGLIFALQFLLIGVPSRTLMTLNLEAIKGFRKLNTFMIVKALFPMLFTLGFLVIGYWLFDYIAIPVIAYNLSFLIISIISLFFVY